MHLDRDTGGHEVPNSDTGTHESKTNAPRAPGRVWASAWAGITPRENPA